MPKQPARRPKQEFIPETELALIEAALERPGARVWATTAGRAQMAIAIARERFDAQITCLVLDAFQADRIAANGTLPDSLNVLCAPDWPEGTCDLALFPLEPTGSKELARDLMQSAFQQLEVGGELLIALPRKAEAWGREQLKAFSKKIRVHRFRNSMVVAITKDSELKRVRDFRCELAFRDAGNLVKMVTRPGVFAHRKLDLGARQLLNVCQLPEGGRALDLGCGAGPVALGLAMRDPTAHIVALDSNARAVDCTRSNAALNSLTNIEVCLYHDDQYRHALPFDLVTANPPYFSNYRIAEIFCENAARNLRSGGQAFFVTKQIQWYQENFGRWFSETEVVQRSRYHVLIGTKA